MGPGDPEVDPDVDPATELWSEAEAEAEAEADADVESPERRFRRLGDAAAVAAAEAEDRRV